jgi:adhesin transport system outer membrane protein
MFARKVSFGISLVCAFIMACGSAIADDAEPPPVTLPLESAILFALNKNPDILISIEHKAQAGADTETARSGYYPQADIKIRGGREYNNPSLASAYVPFGQQTNSVAAEAVINQMLFDGFVTDEEVERRKALETSADLQAKLAVEKILNDTIGSYVDIWHYQQADEETRHFVDAVKKIGDRVQLANQAGAESNTKAEYVQSRIAAAESERDGNEANLTNAISDLEAVTGTLPPFMAKRPDQFDPTVKQMDNWFEAADQDNLNLKLNKSDHEALAHQLESQRGTYWPSLSLEVEGFVNNDVGGSIGRVEGASAMLVLDYKLFDGFARDAATSKIHSEVNENVYQQEKLQRDVRKAIRQAYNQILATKRDLASTDKEIIASTNLQKLYDEQMKLGEGDVIDTMEGQQRLHEARMRGIKLQADLVMNSYALLRQIGSLKKEEFCASC